MKIGVAVLSSERNNFSWQFIDSLLRLQKFMGNDAIISYVHSGTIPDGRNCALEIAKSNNCDYALMIDSDMTFPSNGAVTLMKSMQYMGAKIGVGLYFGTYPPFQSKPMAYVDINDVQSALDTWDEPRYVDTCGMGFTLIHKDLFDITFEFKPGKGEDHLFCKEATQLGHKIILDPNVKCGHLRTVVLDEELCKKIYGTTIPN